MSACPCVSVFFVWPRPFVPGLVVGGVLLEFFEPPCPSVETDARIRSMQDCEEDGNLGFRNAPGHEAQPGRFQAANMILSPDTPGAGKHRKCRNEAVAVQTELTLYFQPQNNSAPPPQRPLGSQTRILLWPHLIATCSRIEA